jgi:uncharacterized membrane protein YphA (DoxX/SURF4 family)
VVEIVGGVLVIHGVLAQLVAIAFILIMLGANNLKNTQRKMGFMSQQATGWAFALVVLAASIVLLLMGPRSPAIQI